MPRFRGDGGQVHAVAQAGAAAAVRQFPGLHVHLAQGDFFSVPDNHQVVDIFLAGEVQAQQGGDVIAGVHPLAVDFINLVPRLKPVRERTARFYALQHRGGKGREKAGKTHQHQHQKKAQEEIHAGAGGQDDDFFPPLGIAEGPGIVALLILPLHGAVAPQGDAADGIQGLSPLPFPQGRPHENGKLVDFDFEQFGGEEMAKLVNQNENAENENGKQNIEKIQDISLLRVQSPTAGPGGRLPESGPGWARPSGVRRPGPAPPAGKCRKSRFCPGGTAPPPLHWRR